MKEKAHDKDQQLKEMKQAHDYFATAAHILKTRVQFFVEEFQGIANILHFLEANQANLKKLIDEIEPPKEEKKEPHIIEVPTKVQ